MNIKLLLSFFLISYVVSSQDITIYPEVDTYVLSSSVDDSFATETELLLKHTLTQNNERTVWINFSTCLLYTSPSPRDGATYRMPSSA